MKISLSVMAAVLLGIVLLFLSTTKSEFGQKAASFKDLGGDFTLQSKQGDISLSDFKGKAVVFYFGYLNCPEVCPNSAGTIGKALKKLSVEQLASVEAMIISLDPARDSFDDLADFGQYFHPKILGLTSNAETLEKVTKQYGAYYNFTDLDTDDYKLEHSSRYYVIDKDGKLITAMRHSTTSSELAAMLKSLI